MAEVSEAAPVASTSKAVLDPKHLFETFNAIFEGVHLSEIAVSPYTLPPSDEAPPSALSLPSIYPFTLFESDKLVIPQKPLYLLYAYAVKALHALPRFRTVQELHSLAHGDGSKQQLVALDRVTRSILLQNPEYLKALNLRKRLVLARIEQEQDGRSRRKVIDDELDLTVLILGIAANAKMATLWHHRRWLLHLRLSESQGCDSKLYRVDPVSLSYDEMQREISLIGRSIEKYPRNYMAWAYRRWLLLGRVNSQDKGKGRGAVAEELDTITRYVERHAGDHTAMSYLMQMTRSASDPAEALPRAVNTAVECVGRYAHRETPWLFLRAVALLAEKHDSTPSRVVYEARKVMQGIEAEQKADDDVPGSKTEGEGVETASTRRRVEMQKALHYARRTTYFLEKRFGCGESDRKEDLEEKSASLLCTSEGLQITQSPL